MERQKKNGWKVVLLVDVLMVGIIAGTAIGGYCVATRNADRPAETTAATEQTEIVATVPAETQSETVATEPLVTLYDAPLSAELQLHIIQESEAHDIDPSVIVAVIWKESRYKATAKGDSGKSLGLMQIQPKWHKDRMARLDCIDLLDPFQNVTVGVDILAELLDKYDGNISMALMAYNAGAAGANRHWFSKGIYSNSYSEAVLSKAALLDTYQAKI